MQKINASKYINTGKGPLFQAINIGHDKYSALIQPDTAFWSLAETKELGSLMNNQEFIESYLKKADDFKKEMNTLRFGLKPSTVYFNPTERCNLNCSYCYIPEEMRKSGQHMPVEKLAESLGILKEYFIRTLPDDRRPSIIFHGSEPMTNKDAVFAGIEKYSDYFDFGIQTNATLLDDETISLIKKYNVGVGISIDGPDEETGNKARRDWEGKGYFAKASETIKKLRGLKSFNVICTVTSENMNRLSETIDFFHENGVKVCMLNILRCTQPRSRTIKPDEAEAAKYFIKALDRSHELYLKTGRKIVVANFANILLSIIAPTARNLMCDISPCGGGRSFFALAANGDIFPCSEFVGVPEFNGGNILRDKIEDILEGEVFRPMITRKVENIEDCKTCAIRHFCGSPCPAEAFTMNGGMDQKGAFCEFYEEQARYAFRLIADGKENDFLLDNWDQGIKTVYNAAQLGS